jgi:hypothetical protein
MDVRPEGRREAVEAEGDRPKWQAAILRLLVGWPEWQTGRPGGAVGISFRRKNLEGV